jgi:hypothetical protein
MQQFKMMQGLAEMNFNQALRCPDLVICVPVTMLPIPDSTGQPIGLVPQKASDNR